MSTPIITVQNLGKKYRLNHQADRQRYTALRDVIAERVKRLFHFSLANRSTPEPNGHPRTEEFWALKGVDFEVKQGEVVGIVGRNGAGKSTLLKILSRVTEPTTGTIRIRGRVASLLEVGTGFHPELTGRENIYLNGAILGMARAEIRRKFDEIVAFADVERFLDTPVKRYSSGMYVRLAFAVAAHLEPEILVVDEVLAVGDAEFQKKCLGKMRDVSQGGRTVLFVSHNMAAVEALCSSTILLSGGRVVANGRTSVIVQQYLNDMRRGVAIPLKDRKDREGSGAVRFTSVSLADGCGRNVASLQCGAEAVLALELENTSDRGICKFGVSIGLDNEFGQRVLLLDTTLVGKEIEKVTPGASVVRVLIPKLCLMPGRYHFTLFSTANGVITDWVKNAGVFDVEGGDYFGTGQLPPHGQGLFVTSHAFEYEGAEPRFVGVRSERA